MGLGLIYEWIPTWVMYLCSKISMILFDHETLDSDENGKSVLQNQELSEYKSKSAWYTMIHVQNATSLG